MCCSTTCRYFLQNPLEIFELWKGGMSFHGGFAGCVLGFAVPHQERGMPILSLGDSPAPAVRSVSCSAGSPTSSTANCGAASERRAVGDGVPTGGPLPRHPSQLYEAALEGIVLLRHSRSVVHMRRAEASGLIMAFRDAATRLARIICEFFREPDAQLGFLLGGLTMGMLLSIPMILAGAAFVAVD
ncbi:MAG: prolipoprotein diacylglyceryl transferase [Gemmatales bacterium]